MFKSLTIALSVGGLALVANESHAQSGNFLNQMSFADQSATVTLSSSNVSGDTLRFFYRDGGGTGNVPALNSLTVSIDGAQVCSGGGCDAHSESLSAGTHSIVVTGLAQSGASFVFYAQCDGQYDSSIPGYPAGSCDLQSVNRTGGTGGGTGGSTGGGSSSSSTSTMSKSVGQVAAASGAASVAAAGSAIASGIRSRASGGGGQVTQNGAFFGTSGQTSGVNMWGNLSGRQFSGDLTGGGGELTLGADWELGGSAILGLALSYGQYDVTTNGIDFEAKALAFGPYISANLSPNVGLDAYVLFARPDYATGPLSFESKRVMAGANLGMNYALGGTLATGYLRLSGFTEDLPGSAPGGARTVRQTMASIGSRFDFAPNASIRPHATLGADAIRFDDGTTEISSTSPHFGLGLDADAGPGTFSIGLDANELFEDARSLSIGLSYSARF